MRDESGAEGSGGELALLAETIERLVAREIAPRAEELDHARAGALPQEILASMGEIGLPALTLPEDLGGAGQGMVALGLVLEGIAGEAAGFSTFLFANALAQAVVGDLGSRAARQRWLEPPKKGATGLLAIPAYSHPVEWATSVTAVQEKGGYRLGGLEEIVPNAPLADAILVRARMKKGGGLAIFAVGRKERGVEVGEALLTLGMRSCPTADVKLDAVKVPASSLVWSGESPAALTGVCERFLGPAAAITAGIVGASLAAAAEYAKNRYQGGKNLIEHSQIRMMLAGMVQAHDDASRVWRALANEADACRGEGEAGAPDGKAALVRAREAAIGATSDGVQILGGYGYMEDYGQERRMRDARQAACLLGRGDILKLEAVTGWIEGKRA